MLRPTVSDHPARTIHNSPCRDTATATSPVTCSSSSSQATHVSHAHLSLSSMSTCCVACWTGARATLQPFAIGTAPTGAAKSGRTSADPLQIYSSVTRTQT